MRCSTRSRCRIAAAVLLGATTWLAGPRLAAAEGPGSGAEITWERDRLPQLRVRDDGPLAASMELEVHASVDDNAVELVGPAASIDRAMPAVVISAIPADGLRVHAGVGAGVAEVTTIGCSEWSPCAGLSMGPSTAATVWSSIGAEIHAGVRWFPGVALDALTGHGVSGILELGVALED